MAENPLVFQMFYGEQRPPWNTEGRSPTDQNSYICPGSFRGENAGRSHPTPIGCICRLQLGSERRDEEKQKSINSSLQTLDRVFSLTFSLRWALVLIQFLQQVLVVRKQSGIQYVRVFHVWPYWIVRNPLFISNRFQSFHDSQFYLTLRVALVLFVITPLQSLFLTQQAKVDIE